MEKETRKTIRFAQLLKYSGLPQQVTLWADPKHDREFMRAVREKRVVTLVQQNVGTKKDYGLVGFNPQPLTVFLVFPEQIPFPAESKVVGVKYELLDEATSATPRKKSASQTTRPRNRIRAARSTKPRPRSQRLRAVS